MRNTLSITIIFLLLSVAALAQNKPADIIESDQYAASITWIRYKASEGQASVMLPKMPVRGGGVGGDSCTQINGNAYFAYADEAVYEFRYVTKGARPPEAWCTIKTYFGQRALDQRVAQLPGSTDLKVSETSANEKKVKVYRLETVNDRSVRWVVPDLENDRWLELSITSRLDKKPEETRFFASLALTAADGIEITDGSSATLGDRGVISAPASSGPEPTSTNLLTLIAKPRPGYTDDARRNNIQGTVILKVTFLANGGIGNVSVVKGLTFGLTENAISAAKRIAFLPMRTNARPITTVKQVEYSFSIY